MEGKEREEKKRGEEEKLRKEREETGRNGGTGEREGISLGLDVNASFYKP